MLLYVVIILSNGIVVVFGLQFLPAINPIATLSPVVTEEEVSGSTVVLPAPPGWEDPLWRHSGRGRGLTSKFGVKNHEPFWIIQTAENTKEYQNFLDTFLSKSWTSAALSKNSIWVSFVPLESKQNSQLVVGNLSPSFEGRMYCYFGINESLAHRIFYNSACDGAVAF